MRGSTQKDSNPFVFEDALEPDQHELVGRDGLLTELKTKVQQHNTVVLTGTRYIGKTSVLNFLSAALSLSRSGES